ncbi:Tetracyclin repressor-like C-terminal domain-containing protein [Vibrio crassostreae]|nr:Tetracyclin repressor-like C-terminal domain-containing protein [Vibrio crassostreae]CAK2305893.1 Tetracyclin repressor-like C-terminal domain-containing protein [Vibrio crassostreae]CAK2422676.1 Tetracyclin repressor-like C-terminal domain-containing protein [Vibrio crassostreae]CAK2685441.1 Tetracyclin repressor-like C-terminal domain-containing protein [Vibrio crassostreae]
MTELPTNSQQKLEANQQAKTKLYVCLKESGLDSVTAIATGFEKELTSFIDENHALFKHACENKPDNSAHQTLLGLLTKEHIDASYRFESNKDASEAMQSVFDNTVGSEHGNKFQNSGSQQLKLVTHLWLFIQGRLGMDYSLANDHAAATAKLLSRLSRSTDDEIRVEFMASFYDGLNIYQTENKPSGLVHRLKRLFNLS